MKNICFIDWDFSFVGGIESVIKALSFEFSKKYNVHVISINNENKKLGAKLPDCVKYLAINNGTNRIRNACLKSFFPLLKYIRKNKIDIVFCMGHYTVPVLIPVSKFSKAKFIFCDHGAIANQLEDSVITGFRKSASNNFYKVLTLTERNREDYIEMFNADPKKIICIPNWVDNEIFNHVGEYNLDSKKIVSVGRFGKEKGYDMLVDIADIVLKKHPDWQWDIYGNGETFEDTKEKIKEHGLENDLNLMGSVNDIYDRYKDYAIFVLPSYREGLPLVLLEAKANHLPIVSFDCITGPREIITDGIDGFLVDCYNIEEMAENISALIENDEFRKQISDNSSNNLEKFDKQKILEQWINLIEYILNGEPNEKMR